MDRTRLPAVLVLLTTACAAPAEAPPGETPEPEPPAAPRPGGGGGGARADAAAGPSAVDAAAGSGGSGGSPRDGGGPPVVTADAAPAGDAARTADAAPEAAPQADPSAEVYDPARIPRIDLTLPAESMAILGRADACKPGVPREYVRATFKYADETLADVGVHLKGEASCRPLSKKPAFKLKFDELVPDRTFRGLRKMTLNNMMEDPTFIAERLSYLVYRSAKLPAPRANSALLYVNGQPYGVYTNLETEDKTFLRRWFPSADGNLYEEQGKDFLPGNETAFQLETNETKNDRTDLKAFIAAIAAARPASYLADLDAALDTQHYLRFTALEALVNQWDMYSYTFYWPNNFRLYQSPANKKFYFLPWGMDMSMQPREWLRKPERHIALFALAAPAGVVFRRCAASPSCKQTYKQAVTEMLAVYEALGLAEVAARYYQQVKPHVYQDTRKEWSNADFERFYLELQRTIREKPAFIRNQLTM